MYKLRFKAIAPLLRWAVTGIMVALLRLTLARPGFTQNLIRVDLLTAEERARLTASPVLCLLPDPMYQSVESFDEQGIYRSISANYLALIAQQLGFRFQAIKQDNHQQVFKVGQLQLDNLLSGATTPSCPKSCVHALMIPAYRLTHKRVIEALLRDHLSGIHTARLPRAQSGAQEGAS